MSAPPIVAVTGATGMLGRHLCQHFAELGWSVRALVRDPERAQGLPADATRHRFELKSELDPEALSGARYLIHCAATTRSKEIAASKGLDETAARRLFNAARRAGVERVVFPSSTSARPDAPSEYGRSKHAIEGLLLSDRDLALRLGLVVAPGGTGGTGLFGRLVNLIARGRLIPLFGGGRQVVQPVHVSDVCRAVEAGIQGERTGTLTVADPDGMPLRAFLEAIARRLGRRVLFVPAPFGPTLLMLRGIEALRLSFPITSENLLGLREQRLVPAREDLAHLGIETRSVEQALEEALATSV